MSIRKTEQEREKLVLENLRLVHWLLKTRMGITCKDPNYEDLIGVGNLGLVKASISFDTSKKIKFVSYASIVVLNEFRMFFRKNNKHEKDVSLDAPITIGKDGDEALLSELIPSPNSDFTEQILENESFLKSLSIILNVLTGREREIILYQLAGETQEDIAKRFNLSQSYISRLKRKLSNKLKGYLTSEKSLQYKEVFSVNKVRDTYQIHFASTDVKNFNKSFAALLQKQDITSIERLPKFKVSYDKARSCTLQIPAVPEAFSFVAEIMQQIDEYTMSFVPTSPTNNKLKGEKNANERYK